MIDILLRNFFSFAMILYMLIFNKTLAKEISSKFIKAIVTISILIIVDEIELWTATFSHSTNLRILASAICYSLRPATILLVLSILCNKKSGRYKFYSSLIILNAIVAFSAFFSNIAYSYSIDNIFIRGPLGFFPHIICCLLLAILVVETYICYQGKYWDEVVSVVLINVVMVSAIIIETAYQPKTIGNTGMILSTMFYFVSYHTRSLKIDPLTSCFNNYTFKLDVAKLSAKIDGLVLIDMNMLKRINDKFGHSEGDRALAIMSETISKVLPKTCKLYRIGGDEFAIICTNMWKFEVENLLSNIYNEMLLTDYTWSMGMAYKEKDFDTMMKIADDKMYEVKRSMELKDNITS